MAHAKSQLITLVQVAPKPKALSQVALNILKQQHRQGWLMNFLVVLL